MCMFHDSTAVRNLCTSPKGHQLMAQNQYCLLRRNKKFTFNKYFNCTSFPLANREKIVPELLLNRNMPSQHSHSHESGGFFFHQQMIN